MINSLIIETKNLNFSYKKTKKDIINLNLKVPRGSIYGFLGPNGSGKSTTIRLILGLLKKESGEVKLFEEPFSINNRIKSFSKIGALIENPSLYEHLTAIENLKIAANYRRNISLNRINEVLEIVKLNDSKMEKVKTYSLGMKQRLGIAISLLSSPELIILDEPTNGLDPKGIIEMRNLISQLNKKHNTTIFISSHLLSEIEKMCTHVGIINNGEILFQDTVRALKESKNEKIVLEIETDNIHLVKEIIQNSSYSSKIINNDVIKIELNNKKEIPELLDKLHQQKIKIYQAKINNNLEELYLLLTDI